MRTNSTRMWAIPPRDDGTVRRALRRRAIRQSLAGGLALLLWVAAITYPLMNESTAVSGDDVLAGFRAARTTISESSSDGGADGTDPNAASTKRKKRSGTDKSAARSASPSGSRTTASASPEASSAAVGSGGGSQSQSAAPAEHKPRRDRNVKLADEGVYTWTVEGYEQAPGVRRDLPREAHRVLSHKSDDTWEEHMIFSEQKEMWFNLSVVDSGVVTNRSRNKVTIGPVTQDKTVVFDPPVMVSNWPFRVGETWSGQWSGKTEGTFQAKTFEHGYVTIQGERVEVYASEVRMQMSGEIEGTVLTRSWVSPKHNIVVKQYMETDVQSGPGDYYSEWMGQVQSLRPQT